jgi:hypothetical protein
MFVSPMHIGSFVAKILFPVNISYNSSSCNSFKLRNMVLEWVPGNAICSHHYYLNKRDKLAWSLFLQLFITVNNGTIVDKLSSMMCAKITIFVSLISFETLFLKSLNQLKLQSCSLESGWYLYILFIIVAIIMNYEHLPRLILFLFFSLQNFRELIKSWS